MTEKYLIPLVFIVKMTGVNDSIRVFTGTARAFESQNDAVPAVLNDKIIAGDVVITRYEGPKGSPGMQGMPCPTSYQKSKVMGLCALLTDSCFSSGTSGLSITHASPETIKGGAIGPVEEGDTIEIDISNHSIHLAVPNDEPDVASHRSQS